MRKHDVRKWIHAVLDMLPLFIIPIFAIYMRNENSTRDISVDYQVNKVVDFNQNITSFTDVTINNVLFDYLDNGYYQVTGTSTGSGGRLYRFCSSFTAHYGHKYYVRFNQFSNDNSFVVYLSDYYTYNSIYGLGTPYIWSSVYEKEIILGVNIVPDVVYNFKTFFNVYDLTQMFGSGNEPSIQEFNSYFPNDYYTYTTGTKQLIDNYSTETYNNTDVGSQMMYSLYIPVKEYFNLNNVANFGSIYDWLQLNFFNGTAPMSVFIVWNIILYEFIMDVLFLIYAVFMFIIDFVECLIDKAFGKSYRGGR